MINLIDGFISSAQKYPDNNALFVDGKYYSYKNLSGYVLEAQNLLDRSESGDPLVGIYAYRSLWMYAAILSILYKGKGYVPLNPTYPSQKNRDVLLKSEIKTILTESTQLKDLLNFLPEDGAAFTIIVLDQENASLEVFSKKHTPFFSPFS